MNVLYSFGARFGGTGIGRIAARSLARVGKEHDLRIAAAGFAEGTPPENASVTRVKPPVRWPLVGKKQYRLKRAGAFDAAVSELVGSGVDVFHSWNGYCLQCLKKARELGVTTIVTRASSHMRTQMEILEEEFRKHGIEREVELPEMIERCVEEYEVADYVEVPSEFVLRSFLDRGFPREKLIYAPFGVESDSSVQTGRSSEVFRLLFVGRIGLRKGTHYLLEAWKKLGLPNAELVLAGNVEPGFEKILQQYRSLEGVVLPGFVKGPFATYAGSSAFAFPSLEEGSALVTYEAMSAGLPVVTTFNSGSLVRDGLDGFIVPIRDAEAICEKVTRLYENRDLAREMGSSGRELIGEYTWERYSRTLAEHYRDIGETRSGARS